MFLSIVNSDSVEFMFNGNNKPIIIKGITDNTFLYLIMPMIR
jgi:DNA polymerase III sliding clamp (beta) subunit (PCNA family)